MPRSPRPAVAALLLVATVLVAGCGTISTTAPAPTPADFQGIAAELTKAGVVIDQLVSGDAGCDDPVLIPTAIGLDASGHDQAEPVRLYLYIFRNRGSFDRLRSTIDACAPLVRDRPGDLRVGRAVAVRGRRSGSVGARVRGRHPVRPGDRRGHWRLITGDRPECRPVRSGAARRGWVTSTFPCPLGLPGHGSERSAAGRSGRAQPDSPRPLPAGPHRHHRPARGHRAVGHGEDATGHPAGSGPGGPDPPPRPFRVGWSRGVDDDLAAAIRASASRRAAATADGATASVAWVTRPDATTPTPKVRTETEADRAASGGSGSSGGSGVYRGKNRVWIPALGINRSISFFSCSSNAYPGDRVYRWGCAGGNNVYLFGHAHSVFKPLHDAYVRGRLKKGMQVIYADGNGKVSTYVVRWWRVTTPDKGEWAYAGQSRPSLTLQTCVGAKSQYRLIVRLTKSG